MPCKHPRSASVSARPEHVREDAPDISAVSPRGHESNWLPAPSGNCRLWLRAYLPGAAVLDGKYTVPPVVKTR